MLRSNILYAIRHLRLNKAFTTLNVLGLVASLTAFILMVLFIEDELSFDKFHQNSENIYRVEDEKERTDVLLKSATSAAPVGPALIRDFSEVKEAVRLIKTEALIKNGEQLFEERNIFFADKNLFKVFSFNLIRGNQETALEKTDNIVLTSPMAMKYFGTTDIIGRQLVLDGKNMLVSGVTESVPLNSHLSFDFLISMSTAEKSGSGYDWMFSNWYSNNFYTYILVPGKTQAKQLQNKLLQFDSNHREADGKTVHHFKLVPLTDIYLHSGRSNQVGKTGSYTNIYIFSVVALFILLIACINFINLATAKSVTRAKEVAIKKVAGASKAEIVTQFLAESFLTVALSMGLSLVLVYILLPWFNLFVGKELKLNLQSFSHFGFVGIVVLVTGILAGSYPAFVLAKFKPAPSLKGTLSMSGLSVGLRKGLVVFQFTISVVLIICISVIYTQLNYLQMHDLGFSMSQKLVINFEGDSSVQKNIERIKRELMNVPGVEGGTASSNVPGDGRVGRWSMEFAKNTGDTIHTELPIYLVDFDFLQRYGIKTVEGRPFAGQYAKDSTESIIINEAAVNKLGLRSPGDAIGLHVGMYPTDARVIGVIKDFHFESLQKAVDPICIRIMPSMMRVLTLDINTGNLNQTISGITGKWKALSPARPIEYTFLNESFNKQYDADVKFGKVFGIFTFLAVIIACLGLFGLALFSITKRKKEIGIRKVLGAGIFDITVLASKQFIVLVLISILIASPIGWLFMSNWLRAFSSRVEITFWIFLRAGSIALLVAIATVSILAIKSALANPARSITSD